MESFSFELRLVDAVSATAKRLTQSVQNIGTVSRKTQDAIDSGWSKIATTMDRQAAKSRAATQMMGKAQSAALAMNAKLEASEKKRAEAEAKRSIALNKSHAIALSMNTRMDAAVKASHERKRKLEEKEKQEKEEHSFLGGIKESLSFSKIAGAAAIGSMIGESIIEGVHSAVEFFADGIKEAFEAISAEQQRRAGYELTLGSEGGEAARKDAARFSSKTAFSTSQVQDQMLPLFVAGMKGQGARTAYATATDLAAKRGRGADPAAVEESVALLARIQGKGGVTGKQLASAGLGQTVPAFFKDLGKSLGVSAKSAEKMAAHGQIDPQVLINAITAQVNKIQGGKAGTGGAKAGESLAGRWNKLKSLPEEFFNELVESPGLAKISEALGNLFEKLNPKGPIGKKIMGGLNKAFDKVAEWIATAFTAENIDKFTAGVTATYDALGLVKDVLVDSFGIAKDFAEIWLGTKIIGNIGNIGAAIGNASISLSGMRAGLTAAISPAMALTAAFEAWKYAFEKIGETVKMLGGAKAVFRDIKDFIASDGGMSFANAGGAANKSGYDEMQAQNARNLALARSRLVSQGGGSSSSSTTISPTIVINASGGDPADVQKAAHAGMMSALDAHSSQASTSATEQASYE